MSGGAGGPSSDAPTREQGDPSRRATHALAGVAHLTALLVALATAILAGQPIYANDTWIHLALGEAFVAQGPWLAADPHLFAAPGPPSPSSWLGSAALFEVWSLLGFTGLRIAHALLVAGILALAWRLVRRASASAAVASAAVVVFAALSTYRLVQLRPDLFTMAATLALYPLLFASRTGPGAGPIAVAALLVAIWSNVHAAFLLAPLLVLGACAAVAVASFLPGRTDPADDAGRRARERGRALRLGLAGLVISLASLANPQGIGAHLAYRASGIETPDLAAISDEWNPTDLLAWPTPFLPPTIAAWIACWLCVVGFAVAATVFLRERWRGESDEARTLDPVLLALAFAGLVAAVRASRFLWLGLFALAAIGSVLARRARPSLAGAVAALVALGAAGLHFQVGDWPLVSRAMRSDGADYALPYSAERFNTEAIWFLADTGVEGRIYNDYPLGGFMSFWLAPRLQMASSGTMNVTKEAMQASFAIAAREGASPGEGFGALLDRVGYDLFLGLGFPVEARPGRPIPCTVRHLEHEPGWLLVFRNLRQAVYLRDVPRNTANLERIAAYYARAGVPFDRVRGFDPESVLRKATPWAIAHGLVPFDFEALVEGVRKARRAGRVDPGAERLAVLYATLGLYDRALQIDRFVQKAGGSDPVSAWRMLWCLAQLGRWDEAIDLAKTFERRAANAGGRAGAGASEDEAGLRPWSAPLEALRDADPATRAARVALLPMLRPEQIDQVRYGIAIAPPRLRRSDPASRP